MIRAVDVEIEYLPIEETEPDPFDGEICVKGCKTCGLKENNVLIKSTRDEVENFAPVSNNSNLSVLDSRLKPVV